MARLQQGTPGPKYDVSNMTRHGAARPAGAVMAFKPKSQRPTFTPGPAAYAVKYDAKNQPPVYSMGTRRAVRKKTAFPSPAPNAYAMAPTIGHNRASNMLSAPMYSMSGRHAGPGRGVRRNGAASGTPGPARYPAVDVTRSKAQAPRPVMLGRSERRNAGRRTPAPNAYLPGPGGSRYAKAPEAFMAGRFTNKAGPYLTAADRVPDWES